MDINQIILTGHITCDIRHEMLRKTKKGSDVINIRVASKKENHSDEADYIECSAFGINARNILKYCFKGQDVTIQGRLCSEIYTDAGDIKFRMFVLINKIIFHNFDEDENEKI